MTTTDRYEVYFRRPNDAVVYTSADDVSEVSLLHRYPDGSWHCALCDAHECRHIDVARSAGVDRAAEA